MWFLGKGKVTQLCEQETHWKDENKGKSRLRERMKFVKQGGWCDLSEKWTVAQLAAVHTGKTQQRRKQGHKKNEERRGKGSKEADVIRQACSSHCQTCHWVLYLIVNLSSQMCSNICNFFIRYFLTCTIREAETLSRSDLLGKKNGSIRKTLCPPFPETEKTINISWNFFHQTYPSTWIVWNLNVSLSKMQYGSWIRVGLMVERQSYLTWPLAKWVPPLLCPSLLWCPSTNPMWSYIIQRNLCFWLQHWYTKKTFSELSICVRQGNLINCAQTFVSKGVCVTKPDLWTLLLYSENWLFRCREVNVKVSRSWSSLQHLWRVN